MKTHEFNHPLYQVARKEYAQQKFGTEPPKYWYPVVIYQLFFSSKDDARLCATTTDESVLNQWLVNHFNGKGRSVQHSIQYQVIENAVYEVE